MRDTLAVSALRLILSVTVIGAAQLRAAPTADDTADAKQLTNKLTLYIVRAITNERILPQSETVPGKVSDTLSVVATPGEYEPASFVIRANEDIESLALTVSDLKTQGGRTISSSQVDIKVVKAWYQDQGLKYQQETPARTYNPTVLSYHKEPKNKYKKVLVRELLLNDESLIKVDQKEKHNYVKTSERARSRTLLLVLARKGKALPERQRLRLLIPPLFFR